MDPENKFASAAQRDTERRKLQNAIREEVAFQGGEIGQTALDFLVEVRVWGDDKYELANFTDDELVTAITQLAVNQSNPQVTQSTWERDLRLELEAARTHHDDIKVPLGHVHVRDEKVALAALLWPALAAKLEKELAASSLETPVIALVAAVHEKVILLSGGGYSLAPP